MTNTIPPPVHRRGPRRQRRGPILQAISYLDENHPAEIDVGRRLRELRLERGLSIRRLAELSQLNVNTLSLIENGRTSPSVSTLQQLALALDAPITAFFETGAPRQQVVFQKSTERRQVEFSHGSLEDLGGGLSGARAAPFAVTLEPHADSGPGAIVHTGHEFVYCLEGRITYWVEGQTYVLEPGDSLYFEAHLPHRWQNQEDKPSRSLLVLCPADERDQPGERHFKTD